MNPTHTSDVSAHMEERTLLLQATMEYYANGQFPEARQQAEDILAVYTQDLQVMTLLAIICDAMGDRDVAARWIASALKLDADYPEALYYQGVLAAKDKAFTRAIDAFERAIQHLPAEAMRERAEYLYSLGAVYWNTGRTSDGIASWQKARRENPDHLPARQSLDAHVNIYGQPKSDLPELDDLYAYQRIKIQHFLKLRGLRQFQSFQQMDEVLDTILKAWGEIANLPDWQSMNVGERLQYFEACPITFA